MPFLGAIVLIACVDLWVSLTDLQGNAATHDPHAVGLVAEINRNISRGRLFDLFCNADSILQCVSFSVDNHFLSSLLSIV